MSEIPPSAAPARPTSPGGSLTPVTRLLASLGRMGRPGRVIAPEIDALRRPPRRRGGGYERENSLARFHAETYRRIWSAAATAVDAEVRELGSGFLSIARDGVETITRRHLVMINDPATAALALEKHLVQELLVEDGLPVPERLEADRSDRADARRFLTDARRPCVLKPASGTSGGTGVTCGIQSSEDLARSWLAAARWDRRLLIESQSEGEEYRLLFLDGELLDVVRRERPNVIGTGQATVLELIRAENQRRLDAGTSDVARLIHADLDCELAVRGSGLSLGSIPAAGRRVTVKGTVSENAASENATVRTISPELVREAARATELLHLRLAGIDLVTPDPGVSLTEAGGTILEVNATPGFHYHYQVSNTPDATAVAVPILERLLGGSPS